MITVRTKGNPNRLLVLAKRIRRAEDCRSRIAQAAAAPIAADVKAKLSSGLTADGGSRPSGKSGPVTLRNTGRMIASITVLPRGAQVTAKVSVDYARYLKRFGILPTAVPPSWRAVFVASSKAAITSELRGR